MSDTPQILVVGSVNMDLVIKSPHMPAPGETVLGSAFATMPGGKGANQAVAAARLGGRCRMIGRVGDDAFGQALLANLRGNGVDADGVTVTPGQPSGVAMIIVDGRGENTIVVASGANACVTPDDVFGHAAAFAQADVVVLQLELPVETVMAAISMARRHDRPVVLDPAPARTDLPRELFQVDYLSPNETEAQLLTGTPMAGVHKARAAAADLVMRGARHVVLKLGSAGALVVCRDERIHQVRPYRVQVVDTTAAGDAFTGALAVAVGRGEPLAHATRFACAAGALAVTRMGAQPAMPTLDEVRMLMADQPD